MSREADAGAASEGALPALPEAAPSRAMISPTDSHPVPRMARSLTRKVPSGTSRLCDVVAQRFGQLSGRTIDGAHQFLLKLKQEMAWAARAHIETGKLDRWTGFRRPMDEIEDGGPVLALPDAHLAEQRADGAEDVAYDVFQQDPTEATRRAYLRALMHHETTLRAVARSVAREGGLRL